MSTASLAAPLARGETEMDDDGKDVEHRIERVKYKTNDGARGELRKEAEDAREKHETVLAEIAEALEGSMACE